MIRNRLAIVTLLTGLNFLNYLDRFIVAAVLPRIKAAFSLSDFEGGLLATVFLLGYFVTAPIFGTLGDRMPRKWLIAVGVLVWSAATIASGLATGLGTLIAARVAVGIGEASYATLAPTIIDDISPPEQKGRMLAVFFLAVPVGSALGYLTGSQVQNTSLGWQGAFFLGGGPGIALAFVCLLIAEPARQLSKVKIAMVGAARTLARIPLYRRGVLGYCAHTAAIGAFSHWGPTFLVRQFPGPVASLADEAARDAAAKAALASAGFWFGTVLVVAGAIGTIVGGRLADRALRSLPPMPADASHEHPANRLAANAQLRVCALGVALAFPFTAVAFFAQSATQFYVLSGIAEIGLFMSAAPINAIMLRTAPVYLRASAMAVGIFSIHLFGDLWSPALLGLLLDNLELIPAMLSLPACFALAALIWWPRRHEAEPEA
ncbi:MAG TPA: MFS transporter [Kofleriaceae bacterium]|nr:MFS transporter [Kofleriaceae bacterium]